MKKFYPLFIILTFALSVMTNVHARSLRQFMDYESESVHHLYRFYRSNLMGMTRNGHFWFMERIYNPKNIPAFRIGYDLSGQTLDSLEGLSDFLLNYDLPKVLNLSDNLLSDVKVDWLEHLPSRYCEHDPLILDMRGINLSSSQRRKIRMQIKNVKNVVVVLKKNDVERILFERPTNDSCSYSGYFGGGCTI